MVMGVILQPLIQMDAQYQPSKKPPLEGGFVKHLSWVRWGRTT